MQLYKYYICILNTYMNYKYEYVSLTIDDNDPVQYLEELEELGDVDIIILDEYNREILKIESDMVELSEMMSYLSKVVKTDGKKLDKCRDKIEISEIDVTQGEEELEEANTWVKKTRALFRDIGIISSGVIIGAVGLAAGPLVGTITIITGVGLMGGLVHGIRKYEKTHGTLTLRRKKDDKITKDDNFLMINFPKTYLKIKYLQLKYLKSSK